MTPSEIQKTNKCLSCLWLKVSLKVAVFEQWNLTAQLHVIVATCWSCGCETYIFYYIVIMTGIEIFWIYQRFNCFNLIKTTWLFIKNNSFPPKLMLLCRYAGLCWKRSCVELQHRLAKIDQNHQQLVWWVCLNRLNYVYKVYWKWNM